MTYLLSICIPTKDRFYTINKNIDYLTLNIQRLKKQGLIELVISDNSNQINKYLLSLSKDQKFINYFYTKDKGLDFNVLNLVNRSNAKYIWFCQDHTRIKFEKFNEIINELSKNKYNYFFLSTKKKFPIYNFIAQDNRYISFQNIYLNTNLVQKELFKYYYLKLIKKFNGSCLVFQHAIIYVNFNSKINKIKIFREKKSDYKYFVDINTYKKNTWSKSLKSYLTVIEKSSLMLKDILLMGNIDHILIKKIYCRNKHSFALLYQLLILQRKEMKFNFEDRFIDGIISHPTFNKFTKLLCVIILKKKRTFYFISKFFFVEILYLIFSPVSFSKRFINKIINLFF